MRLAKVKGTPFTIQCTKCKTRSLSDIGQWYADLDGKPFVDYYCEKCGKEANGGKNLD